MKLLGFEPPMPQQLTTLVWLKGGQERREKGDEGGSEKRKEGRGGGERRRGEKREEGKRGVK